jgi:hypothetical protein
MFVLPQASSVFSLAKERGYLAAGPSPAGTCGLIKQVVAMGRRSHGSRVERLIRPIEICLNRTTSANWTRGWALHAPLPQAVRFCV